MDRLRGPGPRAVRAASTVEPVYALAFFTFGLTDFREAYALDSWLIAIKLANLVALFALRRYVLRQCYPESRLY